MEEKQLNYYEIGQNIRKFRKAYNLSQEQLAERVGISVTHMSHIETGNTKLSLPVLVSIAEILNVRTDEIISNRTNNSKTPIKEEVSEIIDKCSMQEAHILLDVLRAVKVSLDKYPT